MLCARLNLASVATRNTKVLLTHDSPQMDWLYGRLN